MSTHLCKRCGSGSMVRSPDMEGRGTLEKCIACGAEDYSTYQPVRALPRFVSTTTMEGYREVKARQVIDLLMSGMLPHEAANESGVSIRQVHRYWNAYRDAQRARAVAS